MLTTVSVANACITNSSCVNINATNSIKLNGNSLITATPGVTLNMNSNSIAFSNNSAGLVWGNNYSQIYDDGNLHINTDDFINISAPTHL